MISKAADLADGPYRALRLYRRRRMIIIFFFMASLAYPFSQASSARVWNLVNQVNAFGVSAPQQAKTIGGRARPNASVTPNKWYVWTSPDRHFRLEFPGKPSPKPGIK